MWGRIPQLRRLSVLNGFAPDCTPDEAEELVRAFAKHRLTRLDLINGVIDDEARRILIDHFGNVLRFPIV
jgi:hypothetical protein